MSTQRQLGVDTLHELAFQAKRRAKALRNGAPLVEGEREFVELVATLLHEGAVLRHGIPQGYDADWMDALGYIASGGNTDADLLARVEERRVSTSEVTA